MTQDDFKSSLRSLAAGQLPPAPSARAIAHQLLRRDRQRTRLFATLSLLFWTLGAAGLLWLVFALNRFVIFLRIAPGLPWSLPHPAVSSGDRTASDYMFWGTDLLHHSAPYIAAAIACLVLAALFTILLISSSRQATLNRINLSLAAMAEQLKIAGLTPAQSPSPLNPSEERKGLAMRTIVILCLLGATIAGAVVYAAAPTLAPWKIYPRLSPFQAVRYPSPDTIDVQVANSWYQLLAFNDLGTPDLIRACKSLDKRDWQKRFEEDLIEVLTRTHHTPPSLATASLKLTNLATQQTTTQDVPMTKENRRALWTARNEKPTTKGTE